MFFDPQIKQHLVSVNIEQLTTYSYGMSKLSPENGLKLYIFRSVHESTSKMPPWGSGGFHCGDPETCPDGKRRCETQGKETF